MMAFGAVLGLALGLSACAGGDSDLSYTRESRAPQTFPANYKADLLSLLRTYLTDPTGVREAALADPAPRDIRGRSLYAVCATTQRTRSGAIRASPSGLRFSSMGVSTVSLRPAPMAAPARPMRRSLRWSG